MPNYVDRANVTPSYGSYYSPFTVYCCHMGTAIKHPVPDRVKPSFVIFDIRALWRSGLSVRVPGLQKLIYDVWASECPDVKNYKWRLNPVCHKMLYSCTHMATVGFKGLTSAWSHHSLTLLQYMTISINHSSDVLSPPTRKYRYVLWSTAAVWHDIVPDPIEGLYQTSAQITARSSAPL